MAKARNRMKPRQRPESRSVISPVMIGVVVVAAILVVAGLVILGNQSQVGETVDTSQFPTMGDPDAPVTITEFSDYG